MSRNSQERPSRSVRHTRIDDESVIEKVYTFGEKLGAGSFGVVVEATHNETKEKWAIKIVNKDKAGSSAVKLLEREVGILKKVRHKHIIHLEAVYETSQKMYLVLELCNGGELSELFKEKGAFTEEDTRKTIERLTSTVSYLHKNDIVHRDIKLDNILLSQDPVHPDDNLNIKLSDFGLSILKGRAGSDSMMQTMCGTPMYMAPEVIDNQGYSQQCDVWSIGVITYMLLAGYPPFTGRDEESLYDAIRKGELDFDGAIWKKVSHEAKNAIQGLLTVDPAHRLTASELLHHPWITGEKRTDHDGPKNVLEMMKQWKDELMLEENGQIDDNANIAGGMDRGESSVGEHEKSCSGSPCPKSASPCPKPGSPCPKSASPCPKPGSPCSKSGSPCPKPGSPCSKSASDKSTSSGKLSGASRSSTSRNSTPNGSQKTTPHSTNSANKTKGNAPSTPPAASSKTAPHRLRTAPHPTSHPTSQPRSSPHRSSEVGMKMSAPKPRSPKGAAIPPKSKRKPNGS